jgi:hypothetical protein
MKNLFLTPFLCLSSLCMVRAQQTTPYEPALIVKSELSSVAFTLGVEKTRNKHISLQGLVGIVKRTDPMVYIITERGSNYGLTGDAKSTGFLVGGMAKWYPGLSVGRLDRFFGVAVPDCAPHGWFLSVQQKFIFASATTELNYVNAFRPTQTTTGSIMVSGTSLNLGYQQTRILKILTMEMYWGLGYAYKSFPSVTITTPAGASLTAEETSVKGGLSYTSGFTIGVDIYALKKIMQK